MLGIFSTLDSVILNGLAFIFIPITKVKVLYYIHWAGGAQCVFLLTDKTSFIQTVLCLTCTKAEMPKKEKQTFWALAALEDLACFVLFLIPLWEYRKELLNRLILLEDSQKNQHKAFLIEEQRLTRVLQLFVYLLSTFRISATHQSAEAAAGSSFQFQLFHRWKSNKSL